MRRDDGGASEGHLGDVEAAMNLSDETAERVAAWAASQPGISELWLFGSRARMDNRSDSDADLAIRMPGDKGQVLGVFLTVADIWQDTLEGATGMKISLRILGMHDEFDEIVHREGVRLWARNDETQKFGAP